MRHHTHAHSRRDFFSGAFAGILAGASLIEEAFLRAGWARAQSREATAGLFTIEKVNKGVYAALAHPQAMINCNAAIFVHSRDVVVVDAHSKPSAAAALIAQIRKEITTKPVRYLVNTHIVVFSPQKRVVAAGDMISGFLPNINDGYPKPWAGTIDSVGRLAFDQIIAGHGRSTATRRA